MICGLAGTVVRVSCTRGRGKIHLIRFSRTDVEVVREERKESEAYDTLVID